MPTPEGESQARKAPAPVPPGDTVPAGHKGESPSCKAQARKEDTADVAKHGVSLASAAQLDWESALIWSDERSDYGELRKAALALLGSRVYFMAFVGRADVRRIVSLRKANNREARRYAAND